MPTRAFEANVRNQQPRIVVLDLHGEINAFAEEALNEGASLVAVAKSAILNPDWPVKALDDGFAPARFPVTEAELIAAGITRGLVRYLRMINLVKDA